MNKSPIQRLAGAALFCLCVALIAAYISLLYGSDYFIIPYHQPIDERLAYIITCAMFTLDVVLCAAYSSSAKPKALLAFALIEIPIYALSQFYDRGSFMANTVVPILLIVIFCFIVNGFGKKFLLSTLSICIYLTATRAYHMVSGIIKLGAVPLLQQFIDVSVGTKLIYSIDYYLFIALLFCWKGGAIDGRRFVYLGFPEDFKRAGHDNEDAEAVRRFNSMPKAKRAVGFLLLYGFQIAQLLLVLLVCRIGNVSLESALILFAFLTAGIIIKRRWHSESVVVCTMAMILIFYAAARFVAPVNISIIIPIIIGFLICYVAYRVAIYTDEHKSLKDFRYFDLKSCTEKELAGRMKIVGIPPADMDFCMDAFKSELTIEELAEKHHYAVQSVKNKKKTLSYKLRSTF